MRIAYWISALLVTAACTGESRPSAPPAVPASVTASNANNHTRLDIRAGPKQYALDVAVDSTVGPGTPPNRIDVIGEIPDVAIVLIDRYPSLPGGLSYCQAGEESFLRVISVAGGAPMETLTTKIASCRQNLELADAGVEWQPATATVRIHWLASPSGSPQVRSFAIGPDGNPGPLRPGAR